MKDLEGSRGLGLKECAYRLPGPLKQSPIPYHRLLRTRHDTSEQGVQRINQHVAFMRHSNGRDAQHVGAAFGQPCISVAAARNSISVVPPGKSSGPISSSGRSFGNVMRIHARSVGASPSGRRTSNSNMAKDSVAAA
jgi:hypothetical protein